METKIFFVCIILAYTFLIIMDTFVITKKAIIMSEDKKEKNNVGNTLLTIAAIIGGAWITAKLLEKGSKKVEKYSCPKCSSDIDYKQPQCKVCKTNLKWDF